MWDDKVLQARSNWVVKANELIQKSRFSLSAQQQKIVLYLISKIDTIKDNDFKLYDFDIVEFCKVCGINTSGANYGELKEQIRDICNKSTWITLSDGRETLVRWIEKPYIDSRNGIVRIRFDDDMKPYLLQLRDNFTKYSLLYTLRFRSKYSIRLYELLKSVLYDNADEYKKRYNVEELQEILDAEYKEYRDFKRRVIVPAVEEITRYSDLIVSVEEVKKGRKVTHVSFCIRRKEYEGIDYAWKTDNKYLGVSSEQLTLWEREGFYDDKDEEEGEA